MRIADRRFRCVQVSGAELDRACAENQRCGNPAPIDNPAGGDHRHRDGVDDLRQECEQAHRLRRIPTEEAAGVSARFEALRDDRIGLAVLQPKRFLDARRIADDRCASGFDAAEQPGIG